MGEHFTGTIGAEVVSPELAAALSMQPVPGCRYLVTVVQIEETDDEKRAALRAALQRGRDEIAAGHFVEGEVAFAELAKKHFPGRRT